MVTAVVPAKIKLGAAFVGGVYESDEKLDDKS